MSRASLETEASERWRIPAQSVAKRKYAIVSWVFAREGARESVETRKHFEASAEIIWDALMFYEEVPGRAPWLLRKFLPEPVRTEGNKKRAGAKVRCVYRGGGELVKRITTVKRPRLLQFEVAEQQLGIEDCIQTRGGCYEIRDRKDGCEVALRTNYETYLRPRALWRGLEVALVGELHRHILQGLETAIAEAERRSNMLLRDVDVGGSERRQAGGFACTMSRSYSRH